MTNRAGSLKAIRLPILIRRDPARGSYEFPLRADDDPMVATTSGPAHLPPEGLWQEAGATLCCVTGGPVASRWVKWSEFERKITTLLSR